MRNILRVLLGEFTVSLGRTSDIEPLASHHKHLAYPLFLYMLYITDFILLAQYLVHTSGSIQCIRDYLEDFHKYKEVFLCFRATNVNTSAVREAARHLWLELKLPLSGASGAGTSGNHRKLQQESHWKTKEMINYLLTEGTHFIFPKKHLKSHFADQISRYVSLPQYSCEMCKASHKRLKDAYR